MSLKAKRKPKEEVGAPEAVSTENGKAEPATKGQRHRSPAYPAFSLPTAIEKARVFYQAQKRAAATVDVATELLGYKSLGSAGTRAIAALINYGILLEEGTGPGRMVRLSELGRKIVTLPDEDEEWLEAVQEAALRPKIFREMFERWGAELPDDRVIRKFLDFDKNYNPEAIPSVLRDFKATFEFAELGESDTLSDKGSDKSNDEDDPDPPASGDGLRRGAQGQERSPTHGGTGGGTVVTSDVRTLTFALPHGRMLEVKGPVMLTLRDIKVWRRHLDVLEEALVDENDTEDSDQKTD